MTIFDAIDELDFDEVERLIDADKNLINLIHPTTGDTPDAHAARSLKVEQESLAKYLAEDPNSRLVTDSQDEIEELTPIFDKLAAVRLASQSMRTPQAAAAEQPPALSQQSIFAQQCQQFLQGHALLNDLEKEHLQERMQNHLETHNAIDKVLEDYVGSGSSC
jgi:hypothetical protein